MLPSIYIEVYTEVTTTKKKAAVYFVQQPSVFTRNAQVGRITGGISFLEGVGFVSKDEAPQQLLGGGGSAGDRCTREI